MNLKKLYAVTGALAALAVVTYFVKRSGSSTAEDPRVGETLLDAASLRETDQIVIKSGGDSYTFQNDEAAGKWRLQERYGLPVNMDKLGRVIGNATEAVVERLVSSKPERIQELGFDGDSIAFQAADGASIAALEIGRATDNGKQLAKLAAENKAYLIGKEIALDGDANSWLDKKLLNFESSKSRSFSIEFAAGGSLAATRETANGEWKPTSATIPEGKALDAAAVTRTINRFANLTFTDVSDADADEATEALQTAHKLVIGLEGGPTYTIQIGQRPEVKVSKDVETTDENGETKIETKEETQTPAGPVYIRIASSNAEDPINEYMGKAAFEVSAYTFTSLPKSQDELLKDAPPPPPPAPETEPEPEGEDEAPAAE